MNIPLNIDWQQILLHMMNFAILAGGLYFLLYKPVKDFMEKRKAYYSGLEDAAKKRMSEAEELKAQYQEQIEKARESIEEERAKAEKENEELKRQQIAEAKKQAERIILTARAEAERDSEKALHDSQEAMKELVAAATEKLLMKNDDAAIDMFLENVERREKDEKRD